MKQNGKILPAKMGPGAIDEPRERRAVCRARVSEENADGEQEDHAELDEGAEIIARGEEQPYRQRAGENP